MRGAPSQTNDKVKVASWVRDGSLLDGVVAELRELERRGGIERILAVGELILTRFFGGSVAAWRDRRRNKNNSIRRLADRNDCPFGRSALNEAVAIYAASLALPCVRTFGHIDPGHVACVLRLPEELREPLLLAAEREHLSVRELRRRVTHLRRSAGERRGRPAVSSEQRCLLVLDACVHELAALTSQFECVEALDAEVANHLRKQGHELERLGSRLEALSATPGVAPTRADVEFDLRSA